MPSHYQNPTGFTRKGTSEDDLRRFNEHLQAQPWWQDIASKRRASRGFGRLGAAGQGDFSGNERRLVERNLAAQGMALPKDFHIDEGGNINQKSRVKGRILKGAAVGGAALTGFGLAGLGPLAGIGGVGGKIGAIGGKLGGIGGGSGAGAAKTVAVGGLKGLGGRAALTAGLGAVGKLGRRGGGGQQGGDIRTQALYRQQLQRQQETNPLYESILKLALQDLPQDVRQGLSVPTYEQAYAQSTPGGGSPLEDLYRQAEARQRQQDPVRQAILALTQQNLGKYSGGL